ncbi:desmoplakin-like [Syngnathus typhle]|uniref:desmoplakin-like n=1 Tax=Syngnathus typhle TaxID=161592 RepID=UPI002A6AAE86|nr:desmoplakin-like [Syngnathus typhle]
MAFERAENAKRTESAELQKTTGDIKLNQLNLLVREQEALLIERHAQSQRLEGELKTQQRMNDDLTFQKSQLEHDVRQCQAKLERVMADKAASEQELSHSKLLIEQAEAKWSNAQRKLEDLVNENQVLMDRSPTFQRKIIVEEIKKENVQSDIQSDYSSESHSNILSEYQRLKEGIQQKSDELAMVQKRAEMSEEKAQSYKKLLDDRDNRLKKLQLDMEAERFSLRQKLEDLHQETLILQQTISELQEEIRALNRAKSSLEQNSFFQNTEVEGLKEQLKITQGEIHRRSSLDQDNIKKISSLEEDLASKQVVINQLNFKCTELRRLNMSSESDLKALQLHTESVERDRSYLEQKMKSLKSEIQNWKDLLQEAKDEVTVMKRSEQECLFKCKSLEAGIQNCEFVASQLQKKADESKQVNADLENSLKNAKEKHEQGLMEIERKDQQIEILKSQVEAAKSQVKIIEAELNTKSQNTHELQVKLQDHSEHVKTLTEENSSFNCNVTSYQREITALNSDLKSALAEKEIAERKVHIQSAEIDDLNTMLKSKNAEIQKGSSVINKHLSKVKALEDELFKYEHNVKGPTQSSDKMTGNLKQEILTLQMEKNTAEKNVENLKAKVSELSASLHKVKEELAKESKERKNKESRITQLEWEQEKNQTLTKGMSNFDQSQSNFQHENLVLKREKTDAQGKSISLESEIILLREKLQCNNAEAERVQKENSLLRVRTQLMEEQVGKCKRMLEELKNKLELQRQGYERHLMLVQKEMEKKVMLAKSEITSETDVSQKRSYSSELEEMLNEYLKEEIQVLNVTPRMTLESKQQVDNRLEKLEQEKNMHDQDLLKARSQNTQPEEDKVQLYSKVNASPSKARSTQLLQDAYKVTPKDTSSHPGPINSNTKEVPSLLTVPTEKENQRFRKQGVIKDGHHYLKDSETAMLKTAMQKGEPQCSKEEEENPLMKSSIEMATLKKEDILIDFNQDEIKVIPSETTLTSSTSQNVTSPQRQYTTETYQIYSCNDLIPKTQGYMALSVPIEYQKERHSVLTTTRYHLKEPLEARNKSMKSAPESRDSFRLWNTTALNLTDLKRSTAIQNLIKYKILDEDIFHQFEEGLISIDKVQASIAPYVGKPTSIAGIYVESSKKKTSFFEAAEKGFLAKVYALEFLQSQAATGSLTDLATGQIYSLDEALERGIFDSSLKDKLMEAEKAFRGYMHAGKKLSVFQAMEASILERYKGKKILEVQIATGGVVNPEGGFRMPPSVAIDHGFLNKETLQILYDPVRNPKGFHNPDTGQRAYYCEILKACLYDIDGGVLLLPLGDRHLTSSSPTSSHRVSVVSSSRGTEMSTHEAFKKKHIDKQTYLFLSQQESEWHETSVDDGNGVLRHIITDVKNGRKLCLESALSQRFLEASELERYRNGQLSIYEIADIIFSRMVVVEDVNSPIAGLWDLTRKKRLSVLEGFQQGFTDGTTALKLLEAQACTGGICDPFSGEKFTVSDAISKGLLNEKLAQKLQQFEQVFNGITHPKTAKSVSITQAVQENILPKDVGTRCIEFQLLTGGLINPDTHDRVSLEEVIQRGLVDKATASAIKDEKSHTKCLTCPKTKRRITFKEALERSVYDCHTGLRLLEAIKGQEFGSLSTFLPRKLK